MGPHGPQGPRHPGSKDLPSPVWTDADRTARIETVKTPREWSVYLVRCADKSLYTGIAKDVKARVAAHNLGKGAAYTRSRKPVRLVYHRNGLTRSSALIEEARIKALERTEKLAFLKQAGKAAGRAAAAVALLWALAAPARAIPVFNKENGISLSSATPQAFTGENTVAGGAYTNLRMYYLPAISSGAPHASSGTAILSATSTDGVTWVKETGIRVDTNTVPSVSASSITGAAIQPLTGGGFRMLYSIVSTTGSFRVHSATSADGLAWANETAEVVNGSNTYVGVPRLVVLTSGDWRMYYTRDFNGGDDLPDRRIFTALSTDQGATWGASS
ncbi:MAG: GIY-YIG nuclease family protein, partial [Elusimicrobia bacterium]|nr:GIY-YIG nuclease family protein [Elusimicrobiota bacterium]